MSDDHSGVLNMPKMLSDMLQTVPYMSQVCVRGMFCDPPFPWAVGCGHVALETTEIFVPGVSATAVNSSDLGTKILDPAISKNIWFGGLSA